MPRAKTNSTGKVHVDFAEPTDPTSVHILWNLPLGAMVTSVVVNYVIMPLDFVQSRRHDAAVKANATRKAKKEAANG